MKQVKESVIKKIINTLFGENEIDDSYDEIIDPNLLKAQEIADKLGKIVEIPVLSENKSTNNGGFSAGLKNDILDKMREQLQQRGIKVEKNENEIEKSIER